MDSSSLQQITCSPKKLSDYYQFTPKTVDVIFNLMKELKGLRLTHINATALGGGVAEMLRFIVPLQQDIGFDTKWFVIPPDEQFFQVTKKIHNLLQGQEGHLTQEEKEIYLNYNNKIAGMLSQIKTDILIIHDPQPLASLSFLNSMKPKKSIWRCHIDTSTPNMGVWDFLLPYLKSYDQYVFTLTEYVHNDFQAEKVNFITPVIDPLSPKNIPIGKTQAKKYLEKFGINPQQPLVTQISRFDPWKDPLGVIDAYRLAKREFPELQLAMVAQMATDDPEGEIIYKQVLDYVNGEKGIFLLVNLEDNDKAVNAFQVGSGVILQKSIREGFGLTVIEAMYKGAVVIGGNVGGIKVQIKNGINGFLVNSPAEAAQRIIYLLKTHKDKENISKSAHLSVSQNYLAPHKILNYIRLFYKLLGKTLSSDGIILRDRPDSNRRSSP